MHTSCNTEFMQRAHSSDGHLLCAMCRRQLPAIEEDSNYCYVQQHAKAGRSWEQDSMGGSYLMGHGV